MKNKAIVVENLSKRYFIGETNKPESGKVQALSNMFLSPFRRSLALLRGQNTGAAELHKQFWALKDVTFEIEAGEVVGVIGRNGAGKSTLLKLLSHITSPTTGRVLSYGRVASLLEVGTGFHPELTGRENVYLNGTIMGMNRPEIDRKFDEIVDFAGVEEFIDTPVKHYSSGMYVRLGFAVAANLEPDVLIIDEVLSVGDTAFQKKCLAKMEGDSKSGRTVIFVSHSLESISRLCPRTILLDSGRLIHDGPTHETIKAYLKSASGTSAQRHWSNDDKEYASPISRLASAQVQNSRGEVREVFDIREAIHVSIEFDVLEAGHVLSPNFHLYNQEGVCLFVSIDRDPQWEKRPREIGRYRSTMVIPGNLLSEGAVMINLALSTLDTSQVHFNAREALAFQVVDSLDGDAVRGSYVGNIPGVVRPMLEWKDEYKHFEQVPPTTKADSIPL